MNLGQLEKNDNAPPDPVNGDLRRLGRAWNHTIYLIFLEGVSVHQARDRYCSPGKQLKQLFMISIQSTVKVMLGLLTSLQ
jgi:hypothetical protein